MALVVKDRVKQTTTTTGTGSIVLNGTVDGFQTFAAALANGDTTYYSIFEVSTNAYEIGLGTWNESTSTLARTTVLESSNSGSAINLTAQAEVFITYPAEKSVFLDSNGDVTLGNDLVVTGDFTVNGTTTTVNTTNSVVSDALIELGNGTSGTPSNDAGIVIERGSSDNAFIGYDESADKFTVGTGSFTGASTGNLTISTGTLVANIEGTVTGNVTGNVSGSSGSTTGNAATATALQNARTIAGQSFDGTANIAIAPTDLTGVSADAAEINILDGVTSTTAELNLLDGVTATTTELNYVDGVTSAIQTQLDAKASLSGATFTGDVTTTGLTVNSGTDNEGISVVSTDAGSYVSVADNGTTGSTRFGAVSNDFKIDVNSAERMRIDSSGNVGIGSTTANHFSTAGTANVLGVKSTSGGLISVAATGTNFSGIDLGTDAIRRGGMYSLDGSHLTFYTNNSNSGTTLTERLRIDSSGNVGIGATTVDTKLHLEESDTTSVFLKTQNSAGALLVGNNSAGNSFVSSQTSGKPLLFETENTERMRIANSGHVGINFTDPASTGSRLVVEGDAGSNAVFVKGDTGSGTSWGLGVNAGSTSADASFRVYDKDGSNSYLYVRGDGNVGIGTASPSRDLTIKGFTGFEATNSTNAWAVYTYTDNTFRLNYNGSGSDEVVIDSSGRVMIGTTTEGSPDASALTVSGAGKIGLTLRSTDSDRSNIYFSDATSGSGEFAGYIIYDHPTDQFRIGTAATEAMRINSGRNVAVGGTSFNAYQDGSDQYEFNIYYNGQFASSVNNMAAGYLNRQNGDGEILSIRKDGSAKGGIGVSADGPAFGTTTQQVAFHADKLFPCQSYGSALDATIDLGYSGSRFKDIWLSSGIKNSGDLTIDVGGDIILDADGGDIIFADAGSYILSIANSSGDVSFVNNGTDKDLLFKGYDGGSLITALTLDMSAAGAATFSGNVSLGDDKRMYLGAAGDLQMYHDSANDANIISGTGYNSTTDTYIYTNDNFAVRKGTPSSLENMIFAAGDGSVYLYYNNSIRLTTTSTGVDIGGNLNAVDNIYMAYRLYHEGDTDTYMQFNTNGMQFVCGGGSELLIDTGGVYTLNSALHEDYDSLSGTSPSVDPETGGAWSLTMTGNTTFTFGSTPSNYSTGIIIELTGNGSTVTWPASVDWAGGTAPDAPGNGETDIYVFWTRNGGTTWYGALSIDAAA